MLLVLFAFIYFGQKILGIYDRNAKVFPYFLQMLIARNDILCFQFNSAFNKFIIIRIVFYYFKMGRLGCKNDLISSGKYL